MIKNAWILVIVAGTLISVFLRFRMNDFLSKDMTTFLLNWYQQVRDEGQLLALNHQVGNYSIAYQTLIALLTYLPIPALTAIKLSSSLGDVLLAISTALIVQHIRKDRLISAIAYSVTLNFPVVLLNSAMWGQCDSIFSAFCLLTLLFLLKKKPIPAFIAYGLACAFKLQAAFFLPFLLFEYVYRKEYSVFCFLLVPLTMIMVSLGGLLQGRSLMDLYKVYWDQTDTFRVMSVNYPSIWGFMVQNLRYGNFAHLKFLAICTAVIILGIHMLLLFRREKQLTDRELVYVAFLMVYCFVLFLPSMHERYDYLALAGMIVIAFLDKKTIPFLLILMCLDLNTYGAFLFGTEANWMILSAVNVLCFALYGIHCSKMLRVSASENQPTAI